MKSLMAIPLILACVVSYAQIDKLPEVVETTFKAKYPKAKLDDWWSEHEQYHINYSISPDSYTGVFDSTGIWQETSEIISDFDIPETMKNYLNQKFPSGKISFCEKVETKESLRFIRVNFYDQNQPCIIICDTSGKNIKKIDP